MNSTHRTRRKCPASFTNDVGNTCPASFTNGDNEYGVRDDYHGVRDNQFVTIHLCEAISSRPVYGVHENEHGVRADYHGGRDNLYRVRDNSSMWVILPRVKKLKHSVWAIFSTDDIFVLYATCTTSCKLHTKRCTQNEKTNPIGFVIYISITHWSRECINGKKNPIGFVIYIWITHWSRGYISQIQLGLSLRFVCIILVLCASFSFCVHHARRIGFVISSWIWGDDD